MGKKQNVARLHRETLRRVLGVRDLFAIGYGDLGSSIFYALGVTALFALGATPIALAMAGLIFVCTALSYAEMTSMFHESGGSASYARHAFNDLVSFIAGWGLLLDYVVTLAISAFAAGPYLSYFFSELKITDAQISFSVGVICILFLINILGIKQSTRLNAVTTLLTLLSQGVIVLIGAITLLNLPEILTQMKIGIQGVDWSPSWPSFWKGTAMAMVAYTGIESIAQLGAEAKTPQKTLPRAIVLAMGVLLVMYMGISMVSLSAISPHELGGRYLLNPLAGIVDALPYGKQILLPLVAACAAAILFTSANSGLVGASRLSYNMGEYYQLPQFFYTVHPKYNTPWISLAFFSALAIFVIAVSRGRLTFLADLYNFGAMIAFFFAHVSLIVLRLKRPEAHRPFRVPFNIPVGKALIPIPSIIGAIGAVGVWALIVWTKPEGRYLGFAWMIFGCGLYFFYRKRRKLNLMGSLSIQSVEIPGYQEMKFKNILVATREGIQTDTVQMACLLAKQQGAKLTAVQIVAVSPLLPLDSDIPEKIEEAELTLKQVQAIAGDLGVSIELKLVRARSIPAAIVDLALSSATDLIVLGATQELSPIADEVLQKAPCRVWICASKKP